MQSQYRRDGKGHLVREIDALGGEMGIAADKTLTQLRMLNRSKGAAVHSLRAQVDKYKYHEYMKSVLERRRGFRSARPRFRKYLSKTVQSMASMDGL